MRFPLRFYAFFGLLAPVVFLVTYLIVSGQRDEYSHLTKAISELGSLDAPNRQIWNVFGFVTSGLMISVFSVGLYKGIINKKRHVWPVLGLFMCGVALAFSGVFPADYDNRDSLTMLMHTAGTVGSFLFFLLAAFTFPSLMKKRTHWKTAIPWSLLLVWMSIFTAILRLGDMPGLGQRLGFFFFFAWIFYMAMMLLGYEKYLKKEERRFERALTDREDL